ncbi:hypothetical protein CH282_15305 [Rhodococcus sp. 06-418-1B]|nr:hypothetical protein [Rhodococcus sp. 06-418-1B]OZC84502.1 hypothetical protein CH282_15305 [Rhodococcus sp. 06-418-1B]
MTEPNIHHVAYSTFLGQELIAARVARDETKATYEALRAHLINLLEVNATAIHAMNTAAERYEHISTLYEQDRANQQPPK